MNLKDEIRTEITKKRRQQNMKDISKKSSEIEQKLFDLPIFKESEKVFFYVSYGNEVFTHEMIRNSIKLGKKVFVPKSYAEKNELVFYEINSFDELSYGVYNILEPSETKKYEILDNSEKTIIIPGIGFDDIGGRIGHGKGYYDKYLSNMSRICKIGICFEFQLVDMIPMNQNDVKMDITITEEKIIICNNIFKSQVQ